MSQGRASRTESDGATPMPTDPPAEREPDPPRGRRLADAPRRIAVWLTTALPPTGWLLLLVLFLACGWATIVTRTQWVSDSRLYLAYTYWYLGHSQQESFALTKHLLENMDGVGPCGFCWSSAPRYAFFHGPYGAVVGPRALYPLLSVPFVGLFGYWGMLVVPVITFAATVVLLVVFVSRLYGPRWALAAGVVLILSTTIERWSLMAMTEAPAMLFTTAMLFVLPLGRRTGRRDLVWFVVLLELALFTRQFAAIIPVAICLVWFVVWLRDRRFVNPWFSFALASGIAGIATLVIQSNVAVWVFGANAGYSYKEHFFHNVKYFPGYGGGKLSLPHTLWRVAKVMAEQDFGYLRGDVLVLAVLGVALVGAVWRFRSEVSALAVGMFVATYALNFVIVLPTYFRYASPQYGYFLLAAIALLADVFGPRRRRPSRSTEAVPGSPWYERPDAEAAPEAPRLAGGAAVGRRAGDLVRALAAHPARHWVLLAALWLSVAAIILDLRLPQHLALSALSALAMTVAIVLVVLLVSRALGAGVGAVAGVVMILCPAAVGFGFRPGGHAVSLALAVAALLLVPAGRPVRRWQAAAFAGLTGLAVVASSDALGFAVGAVAAYLFVAVARRRPGNPWWPFAVGAIVAAPAALALRAVLPGTHRPAWHGVSWYALQHTVAADFRLLAPDRVVYAVGLLALLAVLAGPRRDMAVFALGGFAGALFLQAGERSVGFGPYLTLLPAALLAAAALTARTVSGWPLGRAETAGAEEPPGAPRGDRVSAPARA